VYVCADIIFVSSQWSFNGNDVVIHGMAYILQSYSRSKSCQRYAVYIMCFCTRNVLIYLSLSLSLCLSLCLSLSLLLFFSLFLSFSLSLLCFSLSFFPHKRAVTIFLINVCGQLSIIVSRLHYTLDVILAVWYVIICECICQHRDTKRERERETDTERDKNDIGELINY